MFTEAAKVSEIAHGGMKAVALNGKEIVLCNFEGKIYAVEKRCGHMNAPLNLGTLQGYIITCPMHHVQFDVITGEALSPPIPYYFGKEPMPDKVDEFFKYRGELSKHIKVRNLKTYPVKIDGDSIKIDIKTC